MTVVFYDIENIALSSKNAKRFNRLQQLYQSVVSFPEVGEIAEQWGYCSWSRPQYEMLRMEMDCLRVGLRETKKPVAQSRNHIKNFSDLHIFIDALNYAYTRPEIDCFVFVSYDRDFIILAETLHAMGKRVIVFNKDEKLQPHLFVPPNPPKINIEQGIYIGNLIKKYAKMWHELQDFDILLNKILTICMEDEIFYSAVAEKGLNISSIYQHIKNVVSHISYKKKDEKKMHLAFAKALSDERICICQIKGLFFLMLRDSASKDSVISGEALTDTFTLPNTDRTI